MNILAYQPAVKTTNSVEARRQHVGRMVRFLEQVWRKQDEVDLIVMPELSTIEYSATSFDKLPVLAEPLYGETFQEMSDLAGRLGCAISYGFPRAEEGRYFISQAVVGPSGDVLTHYDKIHLAQFGASTERDFFSPGRKLGIFELAGLRLGIIICYDFRFSGLIRLMVEQHGVDVLIHPVAFTRDGTFESWHHFVICRALENQIHYLSLNRAGAAWGRSLFCPPWIDHKTKPALLGNEEEARVFTIDHRLMTIVREQYPFRRDRLSDYSHLTPD